MIDLLKEPWPWYVAGPLIGLMVPLLLYIGNKSFGVSSSFRHICSASMPGRVPYFSYDWKKEGGWNLMLVAGMLIGGFLGGMVFRNPDPVHISPDTIGTLIGMGISNYSELIPIELFNWGNLLTVPGIVMMVLGGFLVGFGARYAGGCTSGHAITGLSDLQRASLIAVVGFFIGGLLVAHILLPFLLT